MLAVFDFLWLASLMNKTCRLLSFLILSHSAIASQCFLLFLSTLPLPKKYMFYQNQCDQKFFPNICKSCPKMISLEKGYIFTHLQKLPKESGRFVQINCCLRLKKLAKVQKKSPNLVTLVRARLRFCSVFWRILKIISFSGSLCPSSNLELWIQASPYSLPFIDI